MIKMFRFILCTLFVGSTVLDGMAQKAAEITVDVALKDAAKVELVPFTNFPTYIIAQAALDEEGKGILTVETQIPFMASLKIKTNQGRFIYNVPVYVKPAAKYEMRITKKEGDLNPNTVFKGELSKENGVLVRIKPEVFKLSMSNSDPDRTVKNVKEVLDGEKYDAAFETYILRSVELLADVKRLSKLQKESEAYTRTLQQLLNDLKKEHVWQSVPQWLNVLDDVFARCESVGLVTGGKDTFVNRLVWIGNEALRNKYGVYCLERLVNSRTWFENPPVNDIANLKPYMTTEEGKARFAMIEQKFASIEQEWAHLRNQPAPDFNFEDVNGKMVKLSDYRGKYVLLDVWNIYCGPCMNQVPYLRKLEPELEKMGVVTIGVSCDPQDIKDKWRKTVKEKQMAGIQVIMDNGRKSCFMQDYCIPGFPAFCLIGPDGVMINPSILHPERPDFLDFIRKKIEEYNKAH